MRSTFITTLAWTIALVVVTWRRLLRPALLAAFPDATDLLPSPLSVSHHETHETTPSGPAAGGDVQSKPRTAKRHPASPHSPRATRRNARPTPAL